MPFHFRFQRRHADIAAAAAADILFRFYDAAIACRCCLFTLPPLMLAYAAMPATRCQLSIRPPPLFTPLIFDAAYAF
jgi:hypothetical protein